MGGSHLLSLDASPMQGVNQYGHSGPYSLAILYFPHIIHYVTMVYCNQYHNKYIIYHILSHLILHILYITSYTSHLIALHHSQSFPTSLLTHPHVPSDPGVTMVVLCKGLISILTSLVRKPRHATTHV